MRTGLGGALGIAVGMSLALVTGSAAAMTPSEVSTPRANVSPVLWCESDTDLDCIESVEFEVDGAWQATTLAEVVDWGGKPVRVLNTPGLAHEAGRTQLIAEVFERYDVDGDEHPAYQLQIQSWPQDDGESVLWDPPINRCVDGNPSDPTGSDPCWRAPWLAETNYRMTFRSSKLQPILAMTNIQDMQTSYESISGGVRFSLAGRPGPSQWVLDYAVAERTDTFDGVTYEWGGLITDARGANGLGADCAGLGIATAYSNGNGGQMPRWDPRTGSLSYGVRGFHYSPDGKVYRGQGEVFIPGDLARCLWKVDPRQTARMEIEVFGEDGGEIAGTKSIAYDVQEDVVKMIAIDFTYSQKQIVARPTPTAVKAGKKACNNTKTLCVTLDKKRKKAKVSVVKVGGAREVLALALRGAREDGKTQVRTPVKKGKATVTIKLNGSKSRGQVWVVRTPSSLIGSFQVG